MTNKWIILRRPLDFRLSNSSRLFMCITRLHNYFINEGEIPDDTNSMGDNGEILFFDSDPDIQILDVDSDVRNILMKCISYMGLTRP